MQLPSSYLLPTAENTNDGTNNIDNDGPDWWAHYQHTTAWTSELIAYSQYTIMFTRLSLVQE